jgi:lipopolysaccharide biosynthesis protein
MKALPEALDSDCNIFLKLHTKKSPHLPRDEGDSWRTRLLDGLMPGGKDQEKLISALARIEEFGFATPENCVAGRESWGKNRRNVRILRRRAGVNGRRGLLFPAGSMFYCDRSIAEAFAKLGLSDEDFEPESGQLDGTLSHALERFIWFLTVGRFVWLIRNAD